MKPSVWDNLHPEGGEGSARSMEAIYILHRAAVSCLRVHTAGWPHEWHTTHTAVATLAAKPISVIGCISAKSQWDPVGQEVISQRLHSSPHLWRLHRSQKGVMAACPSSGLCCGNTNSCEFWEKKALGWLLVRRLQHLHVALTWLLCMNLLVNKSHPSLHVIAIEGFVSLPLAPLFGSQKGQSDNDHKKGSYYNLEINLEHLGCSWNGKLLPSSSEQSKSPLVHSTFMAWSSLREAQSSKSAMSFLPWQHAEITRVGLVLVVDDMPVGVVHLDALPNRSAHTEPD